MISQAELVSGLHRRRDKGCFSDSDRDEIRRIITDLLEHSIKTWNFFDPTQFRACHPWTSDNLALYSDLLKQCYKTENAHLLPLFFDRLSGFASSPRLKKPRHCREIVVDGLLLPFLVLLVSEKQPPVVIESVGLRTLAEQALLFKVRGMTEAPDTVDRGQPVALVGVAEASEKRLLESKERRMADERVTVERLQLLAATTLAGGADAIEKLYGIIPLFSTGHLTRRSLG
jgi:hypothetical protein